MEVTCFNCHTKNSSMGVVGFRDECLKCRNDLHCCKNCKMWDVKSYNECREPTADVVREKDRANYCDHFQPTDGSRNMNDEKDKLKAAAEALFKK